VYTEKVLGDLYENFSRKETLTFQLQIILVKILEDVNFRKFLNIFFFIVIL